MDVDVRTGQAIGLVVLLWATGPAPATPASHYLTWINDDDRTVVLLETAPAGSSTFEPVVLAAPLIGGRSGQETTALPTSPCLRDLRIVYRNSTVLTVSGWNVCRQSVIHIGAARRAGLRQHPSA